MPVCVANVTKPPEGMVLEKCQTSSWNLSIEFMAGEYFRLVPNLNSFESFHLLNIGLAYRNNTVNDVHHDTFDFYDMYFIQSH